MRAAGTTTVLIPVLGLLAACGSPVPHASAAKPPVSATPANMPSTAASPPTAIEAWCGGPGYSNYQAVTDDVSKMSGDATGDPGALGGDGADLESDAMAAGATLPPWSKPHTLNYGVTMGYLLLVGGRTAQGDIAGADEALAKANGLIPGIEGLVVSDCG